MSEQTSRELIAALEEKLAGVMDDREWLISVGRHQANRVFKDEFDVFQRFHPLTCGSDSKHSVLVPLILDGQRVLVCPDCDYTQPH